MGLTFRALCGFARQRGGAPASNSLERTEQGVGPYRADIVCRDTATDTLVLIEIQLDCTDHRHLGQIFTYGAGLNAVTIVWIAAQFTDEHRAALDWLNEITNQDVNFFGLEIELWRIGGSPLAPKFNVVSKPNEWTKEIESSRGLTPVQQLQLDYWHAFRDLAAAQSTIIKPRRPQPQADMDVAIGRSTFRLIASASTRDKWINVRLAMSGPNAKPHFHLLQESRQEIEDEVGAKLDWREMPGKKSSRVYLYRRNTDPTDRDDWPRQHAWLLEKLEAFHRAFAPRIKELDASDYALEENEQS
jgi:hypothetical protein